MRRSASLLLLTVTGIALAASLAGLATWLTGAPPSPETSGETSAAATPPTDTPTADQLAGIRPDTPSAPESPSLPEAPHPSSIRNVTPTGILPPPTVSGPLKRVAGTETRPPPPDVPSELAFRRPLIVDAGTLRHKRLTLRLADIDAPGLEETCPSRLGGDWPCGMRARTALRGFVRRQTVTCETEAEEEPEADANTAGDAGSDSDTITARCRRGDIDLSLWLAQHGWARAATDAPAEITEAATAARAAKKGIWQLDGPVAPATRLPSPDPAGDGAGLPQLEMPGDAVEIIDTPWFPGMETSEDDGEDTVDAEEGTGWDSGPLAPINGN
ncbi:hypothetical protein H1W37_10905 [Stappia taiwanensis]|uniref:TNase-like domain-containing protein n=1 Tax=Stappia taiwanensis TaxID=992267 RepID=A0A838XYR4_9HYPH|nr:thermonuclease family protein [Stappia taiwanensis]MBA4612164.1 hypothetical protein [Stappia taiwanensis]GGE93087.1 hypothetical protein GCM10007285_20900 [Stappia taiwanensis]